jgi:hypothetical protein
VEKWRKKFLIYPQTQTSIPLSHFERPKLNQILTLTDKSKEHKSTIKIFNANSFNDPKLYKSFPAYILPVNDELNEPDNSIKILSNDNSDIKNIYGPITAQEVLFYVFYLYLK